MFKSMSVRWKIYMISIASLIGFAGYLLFNVTVIQKNASLLENIRDNHYPTLSAVQLARVYMDRVNEHFNTAVLISDEEYIYSAEDVREEVYLNLDKAVALNPGATETMQAIKVIFDDYFSQSESIALSMIEETADFSVLGELAVKKEETLKKALDLLDEYIASELSVFTGAVAKANANSETLLNTGVGIWLVSVLILGSVSYLVARLILTNIVNVSESLAEIAQGSGDLNKTIKVRSSDEIGELAISFNSLMVKLREKTNDLMNMMENMHQGLFTIMRDGDNLVIHPEYSARIETIFETSNVAGRRYHSLLLEHAILGSDAQNQMLTAMDAIIQEDEMAFDFNSHLLPQELELAVGEKGAEQIKILEIDWDAMVTEGVVDKVMVTVKDVTQLRKAAKEAAAQKEELEIIGQILQLPPEKFSSFLSSAYDMLDKNRMLIETTFKKDKDVIADLFVNMHTIKGNSRTYGLDRITDDVHDAENTYDKLRKEEGFSWDKAQLIIELDRVVNAIDRYRDIQRDKLNFDTQSPTVVDVVSLDNRLYNDIVQDLAVLADASSTESQPVFRRLQNALYQAGAAPLSQVIKGLTDGLNDIAKNLGKRPPELHISEGDYRLSKPYHEMMVNVFTHLLRNAIDHGIEPPQERLAAGKGDIGNISLAVSNFDNKVSISLRDDGRGLAIGHLRQKAREVGDMARAESDNLQEVASLLFESGVSTADAVTDISGRGVGMDAVRKFLQAQEADIHIVVDEGASSKAEFAPFQLQIDMPEKMFV